MPATLTLTIPDEVLERLQRRAAAEGKSPEILAAEDLEKAQPPEPGNFFRKWAGSLQFTASDVAERHDHYPGQALHEELTVC